MQRTGIKFALLFALMLLLVSSPAQQDVFAAIPKTALSERLMTAASEEFDDKPITSDARSALKDFIDDAVPRVRNEDEAVRNIKKFAREMVRNANEGMSTDGKIDLDSFKRAKASVCPLYPFC